MTTHIKNYAIALLGILLIAFCAVIYSPAQNALGESFTGTVSRLDIATSTSVGNQAVPAIRLFTTNTDCDARVISTTGSHIFISFGEPITPGNIASTTLANGVGHIQGASTTVAYDSGLYGCGQWHAWAPATTTITIAEF